jgi:hypothetical protein
MGAGVAFVALFVAGVLLNFGNTPEIKSSDTAATAALKWTVELSQSSHRVALLISGYMLIVAAITFVWFSNGLREWLKLGPSTGRVISGLSVLGGGAIAAGALIGGAGIAGAVEFGENPLPSGDAIRATAELFFPFLFVIFGLASAALIATLTISAARGAIPSWLAYAGWVAVLGSIAGVVFIPFVLPLLWYLALAIVGLTRARADAPSQPQASG